MTQINAASPPLAYQKQMETYHAAHLALAFKTLCAPGDAGAVLSLAGGLFTAALLGGFAHCVGMCGPFVLMQLQSAASAPAGIARLGAAALPGYQLGRMTTYVALGAAAGQIGASLAELMAFRWLFAFLLGAAALSFLVQAGARWGVALPAGGIWRLSAGWGRAVARLASPLLRAHPKSGSGLGGYALGLVLGFLPCGFLYAALMTAAGSGSAAAGALLMAAFVLGTLPGLLAVSLVGSAVLRRWRGVASAVAAPVFVLNAVLLAALATRMVA